MAVIPPATHTVGTTDSLTGITASEFDKLIEPFSLSLSLFPPTASEWRVVYVDGVVGV